jgi:ATP-dependent Lhr-like helicase
LELVEAAALRSAIAAQQFESRKPLINCTDVLIQYLVTLATGDGFRSATILNEVKTTYCFKDLTDEEWHWILTFITTGGDALGQYEEFSKVYEENGVYRIANKRAAMRHRVSIGTIVGDAVMRVKFLTGGTLGTVEESFVAKLNPGEVFWFAGRSLEFIMIKEMTVLVRKAKNKKGKIPTWQGGRMPLSSQLAFLIKSKLEETANGNYDDIELQTIKPILDLQSRWSIIPAASSLLIEKVKSRNGHHLFIYPFAGRFVHEVLAGLIAYRVAQLKPISFSIAINDYGFELLSDEEIPIEDALEQDLFTLKNLEDELQYAINHTELSRRRFRDIATISGLLIQNMPGQQRISNKHLQANSSILFKVFQEYDEDNLLLKQANTEVLNLYIDFDRLLETLININNQKITLKYPPQPTPFAFPIMVDGLRQKLTSEKISDRILKMQVELEKYAEGH